MPPARVDVVENAVEFAAVGHLRGWCHDSIACPICAAERAGYARGVTAATNQVATGSPA